MRKNYTGSNIDVSFEPKRCIHAAKCIENLSQVFDTDKRPWIMPDYASADEVASVVELCPSGALEYNRKDGKPNESYDTTEIRLGEDYQLYIKGNFTLKIGNKKVYLNRAILKGSKELSENPFYEKKYNE